MEVVDPDQETGWCQPLAAEMDPDTKLVLRNSAVDYIPHVAELVVETGTVGVFMYVCLPPRRCDNN